MPVETDTLSAWSVKLTDKPTVKSVTVIEREANPASPPVKPAPVPKSFLQIHPRYRQWLAKCGLTTPESFLALAGEVVCGHPDRHVARVELHAGVKARVAFLKREHIVGRRVRLRNWLAGFGWVSRSQREAMTLERLEQAGLPGPQWLAYGEHEGQAFLLVEELTGATELRVHLDEVHLGDTERRELATRIGRALAELHEAGFGTPELAAKHLFLRPAVKAVSLIDWQSAPKPGTVHLADRTRCLGILGATLSEELVMPRDRLRVLWSYRRTVIALRGNSQGFPKLAALLKECEYQAGRVKNRSSVKAQRQPVSQEVPQRLVWLAGEAVVVTPELAGSWPSSAVRAPYYPGVPTPTPADGHRERVILPDGEPAILARFHTVDRVGRLLAALRERPWRSPGARASRVLFHLQRHQIPAPRLMAFGQRMLSKTTAESFVVAQAPEDSLPLEHRLSQASPKQRRDWLRACGRLLQQLHVAGCRPNPKRQERDPLFMISGESGAIFIGSPFAVTLNRSVSESARQADLKTLASLFTSKRDRLLILRGYLGSGSTPRARWRTLARKVVS